MWLTRCAGGQGLGGQGPCLFVPHGRQEPSLASESRTAPGCGWSPGGEVGQYQVSAGSRGPGARVLGTAQQPQGARLQSVTLPGLSVAGRPAVSQPCGLRGLRHAGLGVLSQSQEMDLRTGVEVPLPWVAGVNPNLLPVHAAGGLAWSGFEQGLEERLRWQPGP